MHTFVERISIALMHECLERVAAIHQDACFSILAVNQIVVTQSRRRSNMRGLKLYNYGENRMLEVVVYLFA